MSKVVHHHPFKKKKKKIPQKLIVKNKVGDSPTFNIRWLHHYVSKYIYVDVLV